MSAEADDIMMCCAGCGKAAFDDIKKVESVRFCSVTCQKERRPKHKRAVELRDELLLKQPEISHLGDCPICFLPTPIGPTESARLECCSKLICEGCNYANQKREREQRLDPKCPFCRHPIPKSQGQVEKNRMKRVEVNDPEAIRQTGGRCYNEGDYNGAFEYFSKAAELGDMDAHFNLSVMYQKREGVAKDEKKQLHHLEEAAIGGHPDARHNLGCDEWRSGRHERAVKHFIIATKLGYDRSLTTVKQAYAKGDVSKEDFAAALRAHQAAVDATKSPQREAAEAAQQK